MLMFPNYNFSCIFVSEVAFMILFTMQMLCKVYMKIIQNDATGHD